MSKVTELEEKIEKAKRQQLKEKYLLEDELEQIKQDKFSYKRKGDFPALEKANIREKEIKRKLDLLVNNVPSLEAQLKKAKENELKEQSRVERKRKQLEKQNTTKNQMNSILRLMRQGKTRSQAAQSVGVPLSRVSHWIREGKQGVSRYTHFYHEVTSIEDNRERRKREEINRQNRIKEQERQRRLRSEREKRQRERKLRQENQKQENDKIKNKMDTIIRKMQNGKSRIQAAIEADVSRKEVNKWFDKGRQIKGEPYNSFYFKVNAIETRKNQEKQESKLVTNYKPKTKKTTSNMITCSKCGYRYNKLYNLECPNCKKSKSKTSNNGSNNLIKCSKCGKWYQKDNECPFCKFSSNAISNVNYCQNCGKKITNDDLNYCSNCGESINEDKKDHSAKTSVKSTSSDKSMEDWMTCCIAVVVIFFIIGFIMVIL